MAEAIGNDKRLGEWHAWSSCDACNLPCDARATPREQRVAVLKVFANPVQRGLRHRRRLPTSTIGRRWLGAFFAVDDERVTSCSSTDVLTVQYVRGRNEVSSRVQSGESVGCAECNLVYPLGSSVPGSGSVVVVCACVGHASFARPPLARVPVCRAGGIKLDHEAMSFRPRVGPLELLASEASQRWVVCAGPSARGPRIRG